MVPAPEVLILAVLLLRAVPLADDQAGVAEGAEKGVFSTKVPGTSTAASTAFSLTFCDLASTAFPSNINLSNWFLVR